MYKYILLLFISSSAVAQSVSISEVGGNVSVERLKNNLFYIASDSMQGRMMGSRGDTMVSEYVADCFRKNGVVAPFNKNSYFQTVTTYRNRKVSALTIGGKVSQLLDDWSLYPGMGLDLKQVKVIATRFATPEELVRKVKELEVDQKLLLVEGRIMLSLFDSGRIDSVESILQRKGCLGILWSAPSVAKQLARVNEYATVDPFDSKSNKNVLPGSGFPEIAITAERLNDLLKADGLEADQNSVWKDDGRKYPFVLKEPVSVYFGLKKELVQAPNVIGLIPGTDTSLSCIVVTAHHDHDGVDRGKVYYGAVDNASGTAVLMEIASLMNAAARKGLRPKRTIVLISTTGEERGLLGSTWYVDHPVIPLAKTHAVLNADMLGRVDTFYSGRKPDSNYIYIIVKDSLSRGLRNSLYDANKATGLKLDTYYEDPRFSARRVGGSDQYPFYLNGIPFIRLDCGFCVDYHKPTDTADKINYALLAKQTQLVFYTLWNMGER